MKVGAFTVAADHPALPGHFPGRPVVPGVMLLDRAIEAILRTVPGWRAAGLPAVKFTRPVAPGECVDVFCQPPAGHRIAFVCRVGDGEVARGSILLGEAA